MALSVAAGRDRDAGCSVLFALLLLLCVVSGFCAERSRIATTATERYLVRVDAMGDGSQVPSKATRHSTARICNTRMVLPAAAGRGRVVTLYPFDCSMLCALLLLLLLLLSLVSGS